MERYLSAKLGSAKESRRSEKPVQKTLFQLQKVDVEDRAGVCLTPQYITVFVGQTPNKDVHTFLLC